MSTTDIKEVVKEKYGQAALRVKAAAVLVAERLPACGCCDPITSNLYDAAQAGRDSRRGTAGLARLRKSDCSGEAQSGRDCSGPRLGRRHRRAAFREASRSDRESLRAGHDG